MITTHTVANDCDVSWLGHTIQLVQHQLEEVMVAAVAAVPSLWAVDGSRIIAAEVEQTPVHLTIKVGSLQLSDKCVYVIIVPITRKSGKYKH